MRDNRDRTVYALVALAALMSIGHHVDHVVRGNHVGWPLSTHVTPFTYSLGVYPLILVGLLLYRSRRVGPGYWALLSGVGALFVAAIHFGPTAVEPPADIIDRYDSRVVGQFAFAWLVLFVGVLVVNFLFECAAWLRQRRVRR